MSNLQYVTTVGAGHEAAEPFLAETLRSPIAERLAKSDAAEVVRLEDGTFAAFDIKPPVLLLVEAATLKGIEDGLEEEVTEENKDRLLTLVTDMWLAAGLSK